MINKTINAVCDICDKVEAVWYTGEVSDKHTMRIFIEELKRDGWELGYNYLSDQIKCPSCAQHQKNFCNNNKDYVKDKAKQANLTLLQENFNPIGWADLDINSRYYGWVFDYNKNTERFFTVRKLTSEELKHLMEQQ